MIEQTGVEFDQRVEEEIEDLQKEINHFKKEKERVRQIVGQIGGMPKTRAQVLNTVFFIVLLASLVVSLIVPTNWVRLAMIELALSMLSLKIILLIHNQMRTEHFQLWILSSLEWQVNELSKTMKDVQEQLGKSKED